MCGLFEFSDNISLNMISYKLRKLSLYLFITLLSKSLWSNCKWYYILHISIWQGSNAYVISKYGEPSIGRSSKTKAVAIVPIMLPFSDEKKKAKERNRSIFFRMTLTLLWTNYQPSSSTLCIIPIISYRWRKCCDGAYCFIWHTRNRIESLV